MDIIFYDFDFSRLGIFPNPISVNVEKKYLGYGCAELHFATDEQLILSMLDANNYLFFEAGGHWAIVTGWQIDEDVAIFGRTLEWLLTKRTAVPFEISSMTAEEIARTIVGGAESFVELGSLASLGTPMSYSTDDVHTIYDVVCEVLKEQNLGFEIVPDMSGKRFVFNVYEGQQSLCMISTSNRTAYQAKYSKDIQDMVSNSGWYERRYKNMGGWDADANQPGLSNNQTSNAYTFYKVTSDDAVRRFGLMCRKGTYLYCDNPEGEWRLSDTKPDTIWIYISDTNVTGLMLWEAVLSGTKSGDEAKAELLQMTKSEDISCTVDKYEYPTDYYLGDIVRVQFELDGFKKVENKRVASVNIYYDVDGAGVIPILTEV